MRIIEFCEKIAKDPRFVCKRDDTQSIVTVWSTHVSVPIPTRPAYRPYTIEEVTAPIEWATDAPGEQPGFRCMTIDQYSITQARFGYDEWGRILGRELRKNKESRMLEDLAKIVNQLVDGFPTHVTCPTSGGFDLLRQAAILVERGDEFWHKAKMSGMMHWLRG